MQRAKFGAMAYRWSMGGRSTCVILCSLGFLSTVVTLGGIRTPASAPAFQISEAQGQISGDQAEDVPKRSVPQYFPCPDQPKTFKEFSHTFTSSRLPTPSELNGSWVLIGIWVHQNSRPDLNCTGITRGKKFEWVIIAHGYSIGVNAIGADSQTTAFKPDGKGNLTFTVGFGGENSPVFRCRLTPRRTIACLGSSYYVATEFKKIPASGNPNSQ